MSRTHKGRGNRGSWGPLSVGTSKFWQRVKHGSRRMRERVWAAAGKLEDAPARERKTIRWELW